MEDIERGSVGQILIKDMSRLGRDHLRVGLFLEQLLDNIGEAVPGRVFLQVFLLMLNGQGFVFPPVLVA